MQRLVWFFLFFYTSTCMGFDNLKLLIPEKEIARNVTQIALQIDKDYKGEELTIVMVMKGAICVTADLMRELKTPFTLEYLQASSYGKNGSKRGILKLIGLERLNLEGKNVLLVDDVFNSGRTMTAIVEQLKEKKPKSLKSLVVFLKKIPRETAYRPNYVLFEVGNRFIVGYGLDYKEQYRGLPGIYVVKTSKS